MKQTHINIWDYIEMILRRKWLIILPLVIITSMSALFSLIQPNIYRASTLILVQPQKVPETYIRSTVTSSIDDRLRTISQQIMSRTMLEKIIDEFDLYMKLRKSLTDEEIIQEMRKDIHLNVRGQDSFELFYQGKEPQVVAMVANKLASFFIEENLKVREQQAEGTTEFLEMELERIRKQLESQEEAIGRFRQKHRGELPEQLSTNLSILDRLQQQSQTIGEALRAAEDRKVMVQRQLTQLKSWAPPSFEEETGEITSDSSDVSQLAGLKEKLRQLQTRYTDKHPEVNKVKKHIQELEARETEELKESGENEPESNNSDEISSPNFFYQDMNNQLATITSEIKELKIEKERVNNEIKKYLTRVENTPKHERELMKLTRDYENIKRSYQSLLDKKLQAQLSANMERKQKGEQFRILDPARIPEKPFKPNRKKIAFMGLILGLGLGGGLAFGFEYMDHSFRDVEELEEFTKLPVLVSIPRIQVDSDLERERMKKRWIVASSLGVSLMVLATVIIHFFIFKFDFIELIVNKISEVI